MNDFTLFILIAVYLVIVELVVNYCVSKNQFNRINNWILIFLGLFLPLVAIVLIHSINRKPLVINGGEENSSNGSSQESSLREQTGFNKVDNSMQVEDKETTVDESCSKQEKVKTNTNPGVKDYHEENTNTLGNVVLPEREGNLLYVNYKCLFEESTENYPVIRIPHEGCVIRSFREGRRNIRGFTEEFFQHSLDVLFSDKLMISGNINLPVDDNVQPFEPDIAILDLKNGTNMRLDIEIDEPYAGLSREPIHTIGEDEQRDNWFITRGWVVIRFTEHQIWTQKNQCIKTIASIINALVPDIQIPVNLNDIPELKPEDFWDRNTAVEWAQNRFREKYLDHDFNPINKEYVELECELNENEVQEEMKVRQYSGFNNENLINNLKPDRESKRIGVVNLTENAPVSDLEEGIMDFNSENFSAAVLRFNIVLKSDPQNIKALCYRGISYFYLKKYRSAFYDLLKVRKIDPLNSLARDYFYLTESKINPDKGEGY